MPGAFSPPQRASDPDMRHGTWCMPGSLTSGFLWTRWRGKRSRHSRCMRNPQIYVSGKRPMMVIYVSSCFRECCFFFEDTRCLLGLFFPKMFSFRNVQSIWCHINSMAFQITLSDVSTVWPGHNQGQLWCWVISVLNWSRWGRGIEHHNTIW